MIMDFVDNNWTNARPGVHRIGGLRYLRRKLLLANAVEVTTEGHAVGCRAKGEAVRVTGQVCGGIAGEKIDLLAAGTEREAVVGAGR